MTTRLLGAVLLILALCVTNADAYWEEHNEEGKYLYGYAGVDDNLSFHLSEIESNHISTNVVSVDVDTAADDLTDKLAFLKSHGQRAIVVLDKILFINDPRLNTPCGSFAYRHRLDFKAKFDNWLSINSAHITPEFVAALAVNTEINNRCISYDSLNMVTQYVKTRLPLIPSLAGYGRGAGSAPLPDKIPEALAGVIFFMYRIFDPRTDSAYQIEFQALKSKLTPEQRLILVPDGFYDSGHAALGWPKWYLGYVALNYMRLALNDPKVVGLVLFLWPGFEEFGEQKLGTRELPQAVRDRHREVGCGLNIQSQQSEWCSPTASKIERSPGGGPARGLAR
ncbi:MAG TPA: hypothetical protein VGX92_18790 [Pyrinomonadaceae bacterium]|jgi:hypothetical protein|nr:hypothetical protein [Pyrinomonadaceae bacterium]